MPMNKKSIERINNISTIILVIGVGALLVCVYIFAFAIFVDIDPLFDILLRFMLFLVLFVLLPSLFVVIFTAMMMENEKEGGS